MKNLEWCELTKNFYAFKYVADKLDFYVPELQQMERSLEECRPFAADEDILAKVRNLSEKKLPQFDFSELATAHTPVYDEDDNLAHA